MLEKFTDESGIELYSQLDFQGNPINLNYQKYSSTNARSDKIKIAPGLEADLTVSVDPNANRRYKMIEEIGEYVKVINDPTGTLVAETEINVEQPVSKDTFQTVELPEASVITKKGGGSRTLNEASIDGAGILREIRHVVAPKDAKLEIKRGNKTWRFTASELMKKGIQATTKLWIKFRHGKENSYYFNVDEIRSEHAVKKLFRKEDIRYSNNTRADNFYYYVPEGTKIYFEYRTGGKWKDSKYQKGQTERYKWYDGENVVGRIRFENDGSGPKYKDGRMPVGHFMGNSNTGSYKNDRVATNTKFTVPAGFKLTMYERRSDGNLKAHAKYGPFTFGTGNLKVAYIKYERVNLDRIVEFGGQKFDLGKQTIMRFVPSLAFNSIKLDPKTNLTLTCQQDKKKFIQIFGPFENKNIQSTFKNVSVQRQAPPRGHKKKQ